MRNAQSIGKARVKIMTVLSLMALVCIAGTAPAQAQDEFDFRFGVLAADPDAQFDYGWTWSYSALDYVDEWGSMNITEGAGVSLGMGYTHYLSPMFGLGVRVDLIGMSHDVESEYGIEWGWYDGSYYGDLHLFTTDATFGTVAPSITSTIRLGQGPIVPSLRMGLTMFHTQVEADGVLGYGLASGTGYSTTIDYLLLDMEIDDAITTMGGHVGFDLDIAFAPNAALRFGLAYYFAGSEEVVWELVPGYYRGYYNDLSGDYSTGEAREFSADLEDQFGTVEINPSFFMASVGIAIVI